MSRRDLKVGLRQAIFLVIGSVLCGFTFNLFYSHKLPIIPPPPLTSETDPRAIELTIARQIFEEGSAIFIDARSPEDYQRGHIIGSINIYAMTFTPEGIEVLKDIPYDVMLIVYCDGEDCELSQSLARGLESSGYQNIRILYAGWKGWMEGEDNSF